MTRILNTINIFCKLLLLACICFMSKYAVAQIQDKSLSHKNIHNNFQLIWEDNFEIEGHPNPENWTFEYGFVRNRELQWYQPQNAYCSNGLLTIKGKKENIDNPNYNPFSDDWRVNRAKARYTSACLITKDLQEWPPFGYFEISARINTANGAWPAIWMLGTKDDWPNCGEIDIMEFYRIDEIPNILANVAWGSKSNYHPNWNDAKIPLKHFTQTDSEWIQKFHTWSMLWDRKHISIYLDDELLNKIDLQETTNPDGSNPFTSDQNFYLLLNLAIGANGGIPNASEFPIQFEIDYVRVYKEIK
nr:glycoside hydrolase family 16 protein [uncultured Draconibacterium sp.]